jgi:hypothetical protein
LAEVGWLVGWLVVWWAGAGCYIDPALKIIASGGIFMGLLEQNIMKTAIKSKIK